MLGLILFLNEALPMTKTELKTAIVEFSSLTTLQVAGQFSIEELTGLKTHLNGQREALLMDKAPAHIKGEKEAKINAQLSEVNNLIKKANKAIALIQVNQAELKQSKAKQDTGFLTEFHAMAHTYLKADVYADLKQKALNVMRIAKANGKND